MFNFTASFFHLSAFSWPNVPTGNAGSRQGAGDRRTYRYRLAKLKRNRRFLGRCIWKKSLHDEIPIWGTRSGSDYCGDTRCCLDSWHWQIILYHCREANVFYML